MDGWMEGRRPNLLGIPESDGSVGTDAAQRLRTLLQEDQPPHCALVHLRSEGSGSGLGKDMIWIVVRVRVRIGKGSGSVSVSGRSAARLRAGQSGRVAGKMEERGEGCGARAGVR